MDSTLKYRIVGAAVLLSLAVIFIPMILDGSGQNSVTKIDMEIPPEPKIVFSDEIQQSDLAPKVNHDKNADSEVAKVTQIDPVNNVVPEVTVSNKTGSELMSWVVQVGAFGEREKATSMQKQLVEAGYDAIVEVGSNQGKEYFRVKVGPLISQDVATQTRDKLRKELKLETAFVTRHPRTSN